MHDIRVEDHGSIILVIPSTDAGREWCTENIAAEPVWFGGYACERRYVDVIIEGATDDGLEVA